LTNNDCTIDDLDHDRIKEVVHAGVFEKRLPFKEPIRSLQIQQAHTAEQQLTKRQQQIVDLLQHGPLNRQELMEKMSMPLADRTLQLELATLKNMGIVTSQGKANKTIWFIKN
jgi:predicted transcriptional regulator